MTRPNAPADPSPHGTRPTPPGFMASDRTVVGYCPMGCGQTLVFGDGGHVTCSSVRCPRPSAVDELLDDRETEHIVKLGEATFTVRHPLRERLDDALMTCDLHERIAGLAGPPHRPGRYRVSVVQPDDRWLWEPMTPRA